MTYAPIVVFGYNRADMIKNLLESLERNEDVQKMDLYIFLDVPDKKSVRDKKWSQQVIEYVKQYKKKSKFKKVIVEIAKEHKGLAASIISGVTKIINKYGKVIVLEDDLIVSNDFLDYMQRGLEFYRYHHKIWSIGGHCFKIDGLDKYKEDVFLLPRVESWGWATWKNRWNRTDWNVTTYPGFKNNIFKRAAFNIGGNDLSRMLDSQMENSEYNSWAIRWGYQQFLEGKYTVFPKESRVRNCGNDNRSTHGGYISTQPLKESYEKCKFVELQPNFRLINKHRKTQNKICRTCAGKFIDCLKLLKSV